MNSEVLHSDATPRCEKHDEPGVPLEGVCEDCLNQRIGESYDLGISVGLEEAADMVLKRACDAFARDQDEYARLLRDFARQVGAAAVKRRDAAKKGGAS